MASMTPSAPPARTQIAPTRRGAGAGAVGAGVVRHPLMPADTPDYMAPAWASCMSWALGNDDDRLGRGAHLAIIAVQSSRGNFDNAQRQSDLFIKQPEVA